MEIKDYQEMVEASSIAITKNDNNSWKPFLRQCMICMGIWYLYFMQGLHLGAPTVLVAQIRRDANSTDAVSDEMSSWLSTMPVISSVPQMMILLWLLDRLGRKITYLIVSISTIISFIIFFMSTNLYYILISQIFTGATTAAIHSFMPIIIAEYTSPKYRGIFLTLKSASTFWGIWVSNAIGTFLYWKNIALVSFVCSFYVISVIKWPESPHWLATKGRYIECTASHRWLKGVNENSEKELAQLINSQKKAVQNDTNGHSSKSKFSKIWSTIRCVTFYKPLLISLGLFAQYNASGKLIISIYAIEVLKGITQDESAAYSGMLILDGVTVFSMYIGCILSRYFKRRLLFFLFTCTANLLLYIISFYLYMVSLSYFNENHIITIVLLTLFSIAIGSGPIILSSSIYGEIIHPRYKKATMMIIGLTSVSLLSTLLKLSPLLFKTLKIHGSFLFFAISSTIVLIILYIYLPETKDKTMQEIQEYFNENVSVEQNKTLLENEEMK